MSYSVKFIISQIKQKTILWDDDSLKTILRMEPETDKKIVKQKEGFIDLVIWLNEGLIDVSLDYYVGFDGKDKRYLDKIYSDVKEEEMELWNTIQNNTRYIDVAYIKLQAWRWLREKNPCNIEIKTKNICCFSPDLETMIAVGDVNPKHMVESLRNGVKEYVAFPWYTEKENAPIVIFRPNRKFKQMLKKEEATEKELKEFFFRTKKKKVNNGNLYQEVNEHTEFKENNLVEFGFNGKVKRGIVLSNIFDKKEMKAAIERYEDEKDKHLYPENDYFNNLNRQLGQKQKKPAFKWFGNDVFTGKALLVKHPIKNKNGVTFEYYTPTTKEIKSIIEYNPASIANSIKEIVSKADIEGLKIKPNLETDMKENATYNPIGHVIELSMNNSFELSVKNYIHEGLSFEQTITLLMAHELGHAHPNSQYLYTEHFFETINKLNELSNRISNKWQLVMMNQLEREDAEKIVSEIEECIIKAEQYMALELQGEKDAFHNGHSIVPTSLLLIFEKDSFCNFIGYKEANEWRIKGNKNLLYKMKNKLKDYEKSDINFTFFTSIFK